jgi:Flp pilus assembly pilin Flp
MALHLWTRRIRARWTRVKGQTMTEYAVILGVITPAIIIAYGLFSGAIIDLFEKVRKIFTG